ncbi:unnamed protein product [Symbiodinium natans]|uniref:Uncharacterized protein n=1 Tax=Symbiodinium natans TaxID=878477 RepID=A0A812RGL6_9DINO|nr:unnamed protein product [Symbiodinium natans]
MPWQELRDEVVARRRKDFAQGDKVDTSLWPFMALAHLPEKFLSEEDAMVRLSGEPI